MDTFSERLEGVRERLGLTVVAFAEKLGIPYRTYVNYKSGRTPPAELLVAAVAAFQVSPAWLISGQGPMFQTDSATTAAVAPRSNAAPLDEDSEIEAASIEEENGEADQAEPFPFGGALSGEDSDGVKNAVEQISAPDGRNETAAETQLRLMRHLVDLHEENRALRARVAELEGRLARERARASRMSR